MTREQEIRLEAGGVHRSPPLSVLAIVYILLFAAGLIVNLAMTSGPQNLNPYNPIDQAQRYYTEYAGPISISAFFVFTSMIPLGLFAVTSASRLLFHRIQVAGVYIALFGGIAAAIFLGVSGLSTWVLSQPGVATDVGSMRFGQLMTFGSGGFAHVAALGLFMAGISVPCLFTRLIPRWICWFGLVLAGICEIATLSMILPQLSVLLPVGRFGSFVWLLSVGFTLPKHRRAKYEGDIVEAPRRPALAKTA
jgi:hypothetical protein